MLMPKKVKYRKQHHPKRTGQAKGGTKLAFGDYGIQAPETLHITLPAEALISGVPVAVDAPLVLPVNATHAA